jgi:hypothetical protein
MAWNFFKSIRLPLGIRLNVSKKGVGVSAGIRGARVGITGDGKRIYRNLSIPGTGLFNRKSWRRKP